MIPFSPRQKTTAVLVARGLSNKEIGEAFAISEGAAASRVLTAQRKLGTRSRVKLAAYVYKQGWVKLEDVVDA